MVTVMVVPSSLQTIVTINWDSKIGPSITSAVSLACEVPLIVIVWLPKATEGYTKPSKPEIKE